MGPRWTTLRITAIRPEPLFQNLSKVVKYDISEVSRYLALQVPDPRCSKCSQNLNPMGLGSRGSRRGLGPSVNNGTLLEHLYQTMYGINAIQVPRYHDSRTPKSMILGCPKMGHFWGQKWGPDPTSEMGTPFGTPSKPHIWGISQPNQEHRSQNMGY